MKIFTVSGNFSKEQVIVDASFTDLYDEAVNKRNILIIKNAFPERLLLDLRNEVFEWGKDPSCHSLIYPGKSYHRIDHLNEQSMTKHIFHSYNFNLPDETISGKLQNALQLVFSPFRKLQEQLSFRPLPYPMSDISSGLRLRPQVIQYPRGGGFFDYHIHPFEPQRVGLILNLSKKGSDYTSGGTIFRYRDEVISIFDEHDMGDIAVFRYDLLHAADTVNPEIQKVDFTENAGRWSAVLPLY